MISLTLINTVFSIFKVITKKQVVAKKFPSKTPPPPPSKSASVIIVLFQFPIGI